MKIKIAPNIVLLFVANAMAFAALHHQSSTAQVTGQLSGTVVDINEARVSGATVTVEGEGVTRTVATAEDGTYKTELPVGTYRIKATRTGFCPARRAPFRAVSSTSTILNFTVIPCPIVNDINIKNGQFIGETDHYKDPFKEETLSLTDLAGAPLELLVRYGSRREDQNTVEYRGAVVGYDEHAKTPTGSVRCEKYLGVSVSYDSLMIRADKVRLDPKTFRLEAEENVVVEEGEHISYAKRIEVEFRSGHPIIKTIQ